MDLMEFAAVSTFNCYAPYRDQAVQTDRVPSGDLLMDLRNKFREQTDLVAAVKDAMGALQTSSVIEKDERGLEVFDHLNQECLTHLPKIQTLEDEVGDLKAYKKELEERCRVWEKRFQDIEKRLMTHADLLDLVTDVVGGLATGNRELEETVNEIKNLRAVVIAKTL